MASEILIRCSDRACLNVCTVPFQAFRGVGSGELSRLRNVLSRGGWHIGRATTTTDPLVLIGQTAPERWALLCPDHARQLAHNRGRMNI